VVLFGNGNSGFGYALGEIRRAEDSSMDSETQYPTFDFFEAGEAETKLA
jgi:hypothetical protein